MDYLNDIKMNTQQQIPWNPEHCQHCGRVDMSNCIEPVCYYQPPQEMPDRSQAGKDAMHIYDVVQFDSHDMIAFAQIILAGDRRLATIQSYLEHYKTKKK